MGREQRSGDWATWMGPPTRASTPAVPSAPVAPSDPAATSTLTATSTLAAPDRDPAAGAAERQDSRRDAGAAIDSSVATRQPAEAPGTDVDPDPDPDPGAAGWEHGRSARREATRRRLLDAAREVFAERGVIGATVEDICEHAGYTRGAFYSNFTDKDEVLVALVEREHALLLEHLESSFALVDREMAEATDLTAILSSIVDRILRSVPVDRQLSLVQTELEIHAIRRPDLSHRLLEANDRFRERIGAFIEQAMRRHGRELLVSPADMTDTVLAVAERSVRRALLAGGEADPDAMASAALPGVLLGLSRAVDG